MRPPGALAHRRRRACRRSALALHRRRHPALRRPRRRVRHADRRAALPRELRRARGRDGARRPAAAGPRPGDAVRTRRLPGGRLLPRRRGRRSSSRSRRAPRWRCWRPRATGRARGLGRPAAAGAAGHPRPVGGRGARLPRLPDAVARRPLPLAPGLVAAAGRALRRCCTGTRPSSGRTPGSGCSHHGDRPRPRRRHRPDRQPLGGDRPAFRQQRHGDAGRRAAVAGLRPRALRERRRRRRRRRRAPADARRPRRHPAPPGGSGA